MPPMPGPGGPGGMGPGGPGMDPFIDPAAGMGGFAIENDFAGMDDLFAIAGPEFGGYAPVGGPAGMPGPGGPAGMPGPMDPSMDFFAMQDYDFGPADAFIAGVDGDDIGGEFFEDLNAFEDARAMNEAAAFANKSFEVQGAYNDALGIERDIFVAPPMPFGMDGGPGMPGPGGPAEILGPMGPGAMAPMTGPMTAPFEPPMPMDTFGFADPFADPFASDPFGDPMGGAPGMGDPFSGGMFDNLVDAASSDIADRGDGLWS